MAMILIILGILCLGYCHAYGIAAPSEWFYQPHFLVREAFALIKEKLTGSL